MLISKINEVGYIPSTPHYAYNETCTKALKNITHDSIYKVYITYMCNSEVIWVDLSLPQNQKIR